MSDTYDRLGFSTTIQSQRVSDSISENSEDMQSSNRPPAPRIEQVPVDNPAIRRFSSCRWHEEKEEGSSYCSHRDVLPFAGKNGFNPEAWCLECEFYKLRRTTKKRSSQEDFDY